jgi:hypothetical protein
LRCGIADFPERYHDIGFLTSMLNAQAFRGALKGFTECYWATPDVAQVEIANAGLKIVTRAGAEGFAGGMRPMIERVLSDSPGILPILAKFAAETSELPQYRDTTEHLHVVVAK